MGFDVAEPLFVPVDGYTSSAVSGQVPHYPLGARYVDRASGKSFMWVRAAASLINSAFAANEIVTLSSATLHEFTNDVSAGIGGATNTVGGCRANSACPTSTASLWYYTWVQIGGFATIKTSSGAAAIGDCFIPHTGDGQAIVTALAATSADGVIQRAFAMAVAAESGATCAVILRTFWA